MNNIKEIKHLGVYGIIIKENNILLVKKACGPYTNKLDLPGGSIEFCEKPENALKRELKEETNLDITEYKLFDANSVNVEWSSNNTAIKTHHIGIFYKITKYKNTIKKEIEINNVNDDSLGADFYPIKDLKKENLSAIAILELEKLGYKVK